MFKRLINYIEYKKKVRLLKMIAVNTLSNFVVNRTDYAVGLQKLLLTASQMDDAVELQKVLNDFIDLTKATKTANDAVNATKNTNNK